MSLNLSLPDISHDKLRLYVFGKHTIEATVVPLPVHHVTEYMSIYFNTGNVKCDHLVKVVSARLLHYKVTFFSL